MHLLDYFRLKGFGSILKEMPEFKFLAAVGGEFFQVLIYEI